MNPTRILDICVSFAGANITSSVMQNLSFSDHCLVYAEVSGLPNIQTPPADETMTFRDHRNFNFESFNTELLLINWEQFENQIRRNDVDAANDTFCTELLKVYHSIAPLVTRKRKAKNPLPTEIVSWIKYRNKLLKLTYQFPNNE